MTANSTTTPSPRPRPRCSLDPQFQASTFDLTAVAIGLCGALCWLAPAAAWIGGVL